MPIKNKRREVGVREAARILGTFNTYVHSLIYSGRLAATKRHGLWVLNRMEVEAYAVRLRARRKTSTGVPGSDGEAA